MAMTFILIILATDLPKTKGIPLIGALSSLSITQSLLSAIYVINGLVIMMIALAIIFSIPLMRKLEKRWKKKKEANSNQKPKDSRFSKVLGFFKFKKSIKIEFVLMVIFQIANFINFMIIFM